METWISHVSFGDLESLRVFSCSCRFLKANNPQSCTQHGRYIHLYLLYVAWFNCETNVTWICCVNFVDVMSKPKGFGSDIHKLLLAAEAGQKADILAYSSGHLGPRSLNQCQSHRETKPSFSRLSHSQKETPIPLTLQQTMTPASAQKKDMTKSPSEFTTGRVLRAPKVQRSRQDQVTEHTSCRRKDVSVHKMVNCPTKSHKKHPCDPEGKQQLCTNQSDQADLKKDGRLKMRQPRGRKVKAHHDLWGGMNVAEMHERKLQKVRVRSYSWLL